MVIKILSLYTLIAFVEGHSFIVTLVKRAKAEMMNPASIIQAASGLEIKRVAMEFGHAVTLKKEMANLALKISIGLLNGPMKMPRSISLIDPLRTLLSRRKECKQKQTLSSMEDSQVTSEMLLLTFLRTL